jgi:large subunit ribosomal protein L5
MPAKTKDAKAQAARKPAAKAAPTKAQAAKAQAAKAAQAKPGDVVSDAVGKAPEPPRLKVRYRQEIVSALRQEFGFGNVNQVPRLTKIVVNMGVGEAARDSKLIDGAVADLTLITGQKPTVTRARKSIAQFKLREGMPIGAHVTLRGDRMWEFCDRLLTIALPRIRDFRGLSDRQFDGQGNYTFGLTEQSVFHEIDQDHIDRVRGMDITLVTTAANDDQGRALLRALGFPFKEN